MKPRQLGFLPLFFSIFVLILFALPVQAQDGGAVNAYEAGQQSLQKHDWNGAVSYLDTAIQLDPTYNEAFYLRGEAKEQLNKIDEAIADYTRALTLNPKHYRAYTARGYVRYQKNDMDGALADYNQALAINTYNPEAHGYRAAIELIKGDLDAAIADYAQAARAESKLTWAYRWLGCAEYEKSCQQIPDKKIYEEHALKDLQTSLEMAPDDQDRSQIFIWLIKAAKPEQMDEANRDLTEYINVRSGKPDDWLLQVENFLVGNSSDTDLLKAADSGNKRRASIQHCQGCFYIGMKHAFIGDSAGAVSFFQQCTSTKETNQIECQLAQMRLDQAGLSVKTDDLQPVPQ